MKTEARPVCPKTWILKLPRELFLGQKSSFDLWSPLKFYEVSIYHFILVIFFLFILHYSLFSILLSLLRLFRYLDDLLYVLNQQRHSVSFYIFSFSFFYFIIRSRYFRMLNLDSDLSLFIQKKFFAECPLLAWNDLQTKLVIMFCRVYYIRQDLVIYHLLACLAGAGLCFLGGRKKSWGRARGEKERRRLPLRVFPRAAFKKVTGACYAG